MIQPVIILVRPQMGENIGAAARAMLNFGLEQLRIVAPRDGWPNPRAGATASGAGRLLDHAGLFGSVADAVADCDHVVATSARSRDLVKEVMNPEHAMMIAREMGAADKRVGILFGPERAGLANADLIHANAIVTVPVNPEFFSLNLAQCVLLLAYEWRRQGTDAPPSMLNLPHTELANREEIAHLAAHYEEELAATGYFYPDSRAEGMKIGLRNMWSRLGLTRAEVRALHGILRQFLRRD